MKLKRKIKIAKIVLNFLLRMLVLADPVKDSISIPISGICTLARKMTPFRQSKNIFAL